MKHLNLAPSPHTFPLEHELYGIASDEQRNSNIARREDWTPPKDRMLATLRRAHVTGPRARFLAQQNMEKLQSLLIAGILTQAQEEFRNRVCLSEMLLGAAWELPFTEADFLANIEHQGKGLRP
jgi:hypothetical protein